MQMVDSIIALTGCAVVTSTNIGEYPYLESRADSVISLTPVEGSLNTYQIKGSFREFPQHDYKDVQTEQSFFTPLRREHCP